MYDRVVAYVTWEEKLLVFEHTDYPEAGIQVPAGRPERNETLDQAVLRETMEETGLINLEIVKYLGSKLIDLKAVNGEIDNRHFYHIEFSGESADSWIHYEENPSDGTPAPIEFRLYRVDVDNPPELAWDHGLFLDKI